MFDSRARQLVEQASRAGVRAAAEVYKTAVVRRLMQGYTSGAFSHGGAGVAGSVLVDDDSLVASGGRAAVVVGTNVVYAAHWEFGHINLFTRKYERVEHWREALEEAEPAMAAAFGRVFRRATDGTADAPDVRFDWQAPEYQGPVPAADFRAARSPRRARGTS